MALNKGAFDSSSLVTFLNENDWRSSFFGDPRQLGFFKEHRAVHSRSTSCKKDAECASSKLGFSKQLQQSAYKFRGRASCQEIGVLHAIRCLWFCHSTITRTHLLCSATCLVTFPASYRWNRYWWKGSRMAFVFARSRSNSTNWKLLDWDSIRHVTIVWFVSLIPRSEIL